jgi:hypothetical protein
MALSVLSTLSVLVLSKIGYKVAEKQRWLPKFFYHRLSMEKLKHGDLEGAELYNAIAMDKGPDYDKALIMRDLIAMNRDAQADELDLLIREEERNIAEVEKLRARNVRILSRQRQKERWIKRASLFFFIIFVLALITGNGFRFQRSWWIWVVVFAAFSVLVFVLVYSRVLGLGTKADRLVFLQEKRATMETFEREIRYRQKKIAVLKKRREGLRNFSSNGIT